MSENNVALKRFKMISMLVIILFVSGVMAACSANNAAKTVSDGKIKVTVTTGMIADVVRNVGGIHVDVTALMPPGVDPHLYKATQGDIKKLDQADIIFYNGLHLEGKMGDIFKQMGKKKTTVAVAESIDPAKLLGTASGQETAYDPHVWFNVEHWITVAETIRDELTKLDDGHRDDYHMQAERYIGELQKLHEDVKRHIMTLPEQSRILVTAHDAFGYFGAAYGIRVMGLQGISTASEAGTKDVTDLRDFLVKHRIKAVFVESSVPRKNIEAVIHGAREKGHTILIGGELFSDAMGEEGTPEGTYIGMVKHNVDTIVKALK